MTKQPVLRQRSPRLSESASSIACAPSNLRLSASAALTPRTRSTMLKRVKRSPMR